MPPAAKIVLTFDGADVVSRLKARPSLVRRGGGLRRQRMVTPRAWLLPQTVLRSGPSCRRAR